MSDAIATTPPPTGMHLRLDDVQGAVRAGSVATAVAALGVAGHALRGTALDPVQQVVLAALAAAAFVGCGGIALAVRRNGGSAGLMASWSIGDVLLITAATAVTGGWSSPLVWLMVLPVVFFAVLLDAATAGFLVGLTAVAPFVAGLVAGTPVDVDVAMMFGVVIAATALTSAYLSQLLAGQTARAREAEWAAERRAQLLDATTQATRSLIETDGETVLDNLLRATALLGFGGVLLHERSSDGLVCTRQVGLTADWVGTSPDETSPVTVAAQRGEAVVAALETGDLHAAGFHSVCVVPVQSGGRLESVLTAASRRQQPLTADERSAVESLAGHAAVALRNVRALQSEATARNREAELRELQHDFASTAAHELRTPLTVVNGASELLSRHWDSMAEDERRALVERMCSHAEELVRLVERLHGLDQLRHGGVRANREPVEAQNVLTAVTTAFDRRRQGHLITSRAEPGLHVMADRRLLESVLHELTENAIRHTPAGTHVHLAATSTGNGVVEFAVADDGPGIDGEDIQVITEAFQRPGAVNTRGSRGIGIGLALVRHILELHDASVEVDIRPPGVCFRFRLSSADGPTSTGETLRLDDMVLRLREEEPSSARLN